MFKISENEFNTWQEYRKKIELTFYLLIILPLTLFVVFFLRYNGKVPHQSLLNYSYWVDRAIILFSSVLLYMFYKEFRASRKLIVKEQTVAKRLCDYFPLGIRFYLKINCLMLLHSLLYGISGNSVYAVSLSLGILVLSLEMPSLLKISGNLRLTKAQLNSMNKGVEINKI